MEEKKGKKIDWISEHKKELIVAGASLGALLFAIVSIKKRKKIEAIWDMLKGMIDKPSSLQKSTLISLKELSAEKEILTDAVNDNIIPITRASHGVSEHIRNLPKGYKASPEKIALATEKGLKLLPGQTLVDAYITGGTVV